ncbi:hypothetical protein V1527DRAFT_504501 [Lipomyces starkeyi]
MAEKRRRAYKACINCRIRNVFNRVLAAILSVSKLVDRQNASSATLFSSRRVFAVSEKEKSAAFYRVDVVDEADALCGRNQPLEAHELHSSPKARRPSTISVVSESNVDTETLAFGFLRNPTDALNIFARASSLSGDEACSPDRVTTSPADDISLDKKEDTTNTTHYVRQLDLK